MLRMTFCPQEREVRTGEEERMRTRPKRENWCSRRMDKVRVCSAGNINDVAIENDSRFIFGGLTVFILRRIRPSDKNARQR